MTPTQDLDREQDPGVRSRRSKMTHVSLIMLGVVLLAVFGALGLPGNADLQDPVNQPASSVEPTPVADYPQPSEGSVAPSPNPQKNAPHDVPAPIVCRNSTDERCGPFWWDPKPDPDQPMEIVVTISPAHPKVGEEVTITVTVSDPDATIKQHQVFCGDESFRLIPPLKLMPRFGPWTPPPKEEGLFKQTITHVYTEAGTFHGEVWADSGNLNGNPYGEEKAESFTVVVEEDPSPTPSPEPSSSQTADPVPTETPAA